MCLISLKFFSTCAILATRTDLQANNLTTTHPPWVTTQGEEKGASVVVLLTVLLFNDVLFKLSSCEFYNAVGSVTWRFSR